MQDINEQSNLVQEEQQENSRKMWQRIAGGLGCLLGFGAGVGCGSTIVAQTTGARCGIELGLGSAVGLPSGFGTMKLTALLSQSKMGMWCNSLCQCQDSDSDITHEAKATTFQSQL